ncbi:MAG: nuclear transport factor 2 family protein [Melioribacteraceae bacterium]|nr:nuclear transport factor 2 family protein [Melioribacteraceae bacterium]
MTNIEVTVNFLRAYAKGDIKEVEKLIASDFNFDDPSTEFKTKDSYLESLNNNSVAASDFNILHTFENGNEVLLIYLFEKNGINTRISHYFKVDDDKINEMSLIYDKSVFK